MSMKMWNKSTDGASLPTYNFAKVFPHNGKYIFTVGQRKVNLHF